MDVFGTESLVACSRLASSLGALVGIRHPCRGLLSPGGPHLHLLQSLLEQPRSAPQTGSSCVFLSSLFSILCLLALLPGTVPRACFSSLPSTWESLFAHSLTTWFLWERIGTRLKSNEIQFQNIFALVGNKLGITGHCRAPTDENCLSTESTQDN